MIISYNLNAVGDVLLVVVGNGEGKEIKTERKGHVVKISDSQTDELLGWNIFDASNVITDLTGVGQIHLTDEQDAELKQAIKDAGFNDTIVIDDTPKFVVGYVKTCVPHPDSNHLSITETEVGNGETLQIVCGAPNIRAGLKVVVAKVGAMMPDGLIIWPGELRGEASFGMICSAKELNLSNAPTKKGILELPADEQIGREFQVGI
ncbi:YtpR family tRNA-binding protein [Vagococcus vulneris]|uniref:tRNA-binding protein n=1 Tax=Vagococcus vulneris TaxID=1977869 RepID=A0A429ZWG0_9ENTE|nr:DUF4479 and tRNA-binding domain-containing protein [Vagococcus vulneris]RST98112.1 tRNA-binding protein [Vagococcus vulneris]